MKYAKTFSKKIAIALTVLISASNMGVLSSAFDPSSLFDTDQTDLNNLIQNAVNAVSQLDDSSSLADDIISADADDIGIDIEKIATDMLNSITSNGSYESMTQEDVNKIIADAVSNAIAEAAQGSSDSYSTSANTDTPDAPVTPYADGLKWLEDTVSPEVIGGGNEDAHPPKLSADEREDTYLYLCDAIRDLYKGTCFESYTSVALQDLKDAYEDDYNYRDNSDLWSFYDSIRKNTVLSYISEQPELPASFESDALRILRMKPDNEAYLEAKFDAEQLTSNYAEFLNSYDPTLEADPVRTTWFLVALAGELHPVSDIKEIASDLESRAQSWYNEQESAAETSETTETTDTDSSRELSREEAEAIWLKDLAPCGLDYIAASTDYGETETYCYPEHIYNLYYSAVKYTSTPKYDLTANGAHAFAADIKAAADATDAIIKSADSKYNITGYYWARRGNALGIVILQDEGATKLDETFRKSIWTNWYGLPETAPSIFGYIKGIDFTEDADATSAPIDTALGAAIEEIDVTSTVTADTSFDTAAEETDAASTVTVDASIDTATEEAYAGNTVTVDTSTLTDAFDISQMSPQEIEKYIDTMVEASLASATKTTDTPLVTAGNTTNNGAWKDSPKTVETPVSGIFWLMGILGVIGTGTFGVIYTIKKRH